MHSVNIRRKRLQFKKQEFTRKESNANESRVYSLAVARDGSQQQDNTERLFGQTGQIGGDLAKNSEHSEQNSKNENNGRPSGAKARK